MSGLNAEFARRGLNARAVPFSATCPVKGYRQRAACRDELQHVHASRLTRATVPDGYTAVVAATQTASGKVELVQGAVPLACAVVLQHRDPNSYPA